jgi:hypothetical protein
MTFRNDASPAGAALVTRSTTTAAEPGAVSSATLAHHRTALVAEGEPREEALLADSLIMPTAVFESSGLQEVHGAFAVVRSA